MGGVEVKAMPEIAHTIGGTVLPRGRGPDHGDTSVFDLLHILSHNVVPGTGSLIGFPKEALEDDVIPSIVENMLTVDDRPGVGDLSE
jgi:hypothetical protein